MKGPIQSIEVSLFVHVTEDEPRLLETVVRTLAIESGPQKEELEGHFGNRIVRVSYHLVGDEAGRVFEGLASGLPRRAREELKRDLGASIDEHSALYLRLDKQMMMSGELGFASSDPVRVRVKPRLFLMKGGAYPFYLRMLGLDA